MIIIIRPIGCYLLIPYIHHQTLQQHQPLCEYYVLIYRCIFIIIGTVDVEKLLSADDEIFVEPCNRNDRNDRLLKNS